MSNVKNRIVRVSDEELAAIKALREARSASGEQTEVAEPEASNPHRELADAFVEAIERTKPKEKKTPFNRNVQTPWHKSGEPRSKMKRRYFHHGMLIGDKISNQEIDLLNKIKPGLYCDGFVKVELRRDRGLNVDYPMQTTSQRLKLVNQYGIRNFAELLQRIIDEKSNPTKYRRPEELDLYEADDLN